jgi:S-disulfanyl-L-cysteine oxidoreductase SoxD
MLRRSTIACLGIVLAGTTDAAATTQAGYGVGRAATAAEVEAWNIDVRPDGHGLPPGRGSVADGQGIYDAKCAVCHGTFGESAQYIQLAGGVGTLKSSAPVRTVGSLLAHATTLYDYIYRAMPFNNSKSLTPNETYSLTAYVLNLNDILPADAVLDQNSLPAVKMPNRNGYTLFPGLMTPKGSSDVHNTACMKNCETTVAISSELPPRFVADVYGNLSDDFRGLATMNHVRPAPPAPPPDHSAVKLAEQSGCLGCHAVDHRVVGPAFRDVASKYKSSPGAATFLASKVKSGGKGTWGDIPMPPNSGVTDTSIKTLVQWVLAGATSP